MTHPPLSVTHVASALITHIPAIRATHGLLSINNVPQALEALITALGGGHGGKGGNNGGGHHNNNNNENFIERLIDIVTGGSCASCSRVCSKTMTHPVDMKLVVRATEALVRAMDVTMRRTKKTSLVRYLYEYVTTKLDSKLKRAGVPIPSKRLLGFGTLLKYDVTRGVRLKVLDYVLDNYVRYYVPHITYSTSNVEALVFRNFKPEVLAFLRGTDADLGPLAGRLMKYALEANDLTAIRTGTPACFLCTRIPVSCTQRETRPTRRKRNASWKNSRWPESNGKDPAINGTKDQSDGRGKACSGGTRHRARCVSLEPRDTRKLRKGVPQQRKDEKRDGHDPSMAFQRF